MKALVAYYSRTGNTEKLAEEIAARMGADLQKIREERSRAGLKGAFLSCWHSFAEKKPEIKEADKVPEDYDIVILGTPVWAGNVAAPVRTFMIKHREVFDKAAFFNTFGITRSDKIFATMQELVGKRPETVLGINKKLLQKDQYADRVEQFVEEIRESFA